MPLGYYEKYLEYTSKKFRNLVKILCGIGGERRRKVLVDIERILHSIIPTYTPKRKSKNHEYVLLTSRFFAMLCSESQFWCRRQHY